MVCFKKKSRSNPLFWYVNHFWDWNVNFMAVPNVKLRRFKSILLSIILRRYILFLLKMQGIQNQNMQVDLNYNSIIVSVWKVLHLKKMYSILHDRSLQDRPEVSNNQSWEWNQWSREQWYIESLLHHLIVLEHNINIII